MFCAKTGLPGEMFASVDKALDERTIGHNPERLCLMKVYHWACQMMPTATDIPMANYSVVFGMHLTQYASPLAQNKAIFTSNIKETL